MATRPHGARAPVPEDLPHDLPEGERRPARIRLVARRRLAGLTVVLEAVHDPHNISAVLRSCEGFGLQSVHLVGECGFPNRAITRGCEKWLDLGRYRTAPECVACLRAGGFRLLAAMPDRSAPALDEIDFSRKVALVFGAERDGLSEGLLASCDGRYQIPMPGFSQSLNVSVAAAISIYAGASARRKALGRLSDIGDAESDDLARRWLEADVL